MRELVCVLSVDVWMLGCLGDSVFGVLSFVCVFVIVYLCSVFC